MDSQSWELLSSSTLLRSDGNGRWRRLTSFQAEQGIPVEVHVSERTGLRVMHAKVKGPLVTGMACIATEALNDDGVPHALQHLVLMGSEDVPYKGALDQTVAAPPGCLLLPGGVKAWTDVDHTLFSLTTAGPSGFLALLPLLMDHLLFPTLTEAAFKTEVHHIDGAGHDGGTVYTEMLEETKNESGEAVARQRLLEALYPPGSGYRAVTGGKPAQIRKLTNEAVRAYHKNYYHTGNLALIITGDVETAEVLKRLEGLEAKVLQQAQQAASSSSSLSASMSLLHGRPWFHRRHYAPEANTHTDKPRVEHVTFPLPSQATHQQQHQTEEGGSGGGQQQHHQQHPSPRSTSPHTHTHTHPPPHTHTHTTTNPNNNNDSNNTSVVLLGWLGPSWEDFQTNLCLRIMWLYLAGGALSPLHRVLVEEKGLCSKLSFVVQEGRPGCHYLVCEGVEGGRGEEVYEVVVGVIRSVIASEDENGGGGGGGEGQGQQYRLDMGRLRALVHREKLRYLSDVEEDPHSTLASLLLYSFLYGQREGEGGGDTHTHTHTGGGAQLKDHVQNTASRLEALPCREEGEEDRRFWCELMGGGGGGGAGLLDPGRTVVVVAEGSGALAREREEVEMRRVEEQVRGLQVEELVVLGEGLEAARGEMEKVCSPKLLAGLLPSCVAGRGAGGDETATAGAKVPPLVLPAVPVCTVRNVLTPMGKTKFEVLSINATATTNNNNTNNNQQPTEGKQEEDDESDTDTHTLLSSPSSSSFSSSQPPTLSLPTPDFVFKGFHSDHPSSSPSSYTRSSSSSSSYPPSSSPSPTAIRVAHALHGKGLGRTQPLPFFVQWDHIQDTAFVEVTVWLETSSLPDYLRPYLELWLEVLFELPLRQEDGSLWSHEEVTRFLAADTLSFSSALGTGRSNFYAGIWSQAASVTLKVEAEKYWLAVRWLKNLLYRSEVTPDRVYAVATKLLVDIQGYKRDGMSICSGLMRGINFDSAKSNHATTNFIRQYGVLTAALQRLRSDPLGLLGDLTLLQEMLTQPWNLRVHVVCDVLAQPDPVQPWLRDFLPLPQARLARKALEAAERGGREEEGGSNSGNKNNNTTTTTTSAANLLLASMTSSTHSSTSSTTSSSTTAAAAASAAEAAAALPPLPLILSSLFCPVLESRHLRTAESLNPTGKGLLISSPTIDSGYLIQCAPFDPDSDGLSYGSRGYAAVLVAMEYLTNHVQGQGQTQIYTHGGGGGGGGAGERHSVGGGSATAGGAVAPAPARGGAGGNNNNNNNTSDNTSTTTTTQGLPPSLSLPSSTYEMTCSPEQGLLTFTLYKTPTLSQSYADIQDLIRRYAKQDLPLKPRHLDTAKATVLFEYLERVWTGPAAAQQSFLNYFRNTPPTFCTHTMHTLQTITQEEVLSAIQQHILRLFDVTHTSMVAACPSSQALSLKYDLVRKLGRPSVESGTIERCLARMAMEEDMSSDTGSATSGSDASYALDLLEGRGGNHYGGGGGGGAAIVQRWVNEVARPDRLLWAAAAAVSVAFLVNNSKK